ncbi:MAG TPA: DUF488 family protein [Spirochaetia bacterium]|nr:DUF488 family protein [Spirochaetia bacterium]
MAIRVVRLGSPRSAGEGLRIGTVRRPPRGVRKEDYARLDYYDAWLPQVAPSNELVSWIRARAGSPAAWKQFEKRYLRELEAPDTRRLLELLAALSHGTDFSVGCFCEEESKCHRSYLRKALAAHGAVFA